MRIGALVAASIAALKVVVPTAAVTVVTAMKVSVPVAAILAVASIAANKAAAPALSAPPFAGSVTAPEIDVMSGGAAIAIVGAALALLRERSRR